jgi:hypothetical protein
VCACAWSNLLPGLIVLPTVSLLRLPQQAPGSAPATQQGLHRRRRPTHAWTISATSAAVRGQALLPPPLVCRSSSSSAACPDAHGWVRARTLPRSSRCMALAWVSIAVTQLMQTEQAQFPRRSTRAYRPSRRALHRHGSTAVRRACGPSAALSPRTRTAMGSFSLRSGSPSANVASRRNRTRAIVIQKTRRPSRLPCRRGNPRSLVLLAPHPALSPIPPLRAPLPVHLSTPPLLRPSQRLHTHRPHMRSSLREARVHLGPLRARNLMGAWRPQARTS